MDNYIPTARESVPNAYRDIIFNNPRNILSEGDDRRNRALQLETAAAEFDTDLALLDYQNAYDRMYNNPTAKAERLKAAGINPDLAGLEGDPTLTSADASTQGLAGKLAKDSTPLQMVNSISSLINQVISTYGQIQNIKSTTLDNDMKSINNLRSMLDLGFKQIDSELPYLSSVASGSTGDLRSKHFIPLTSTFGSNRTRKMSKRLDSIFSNYIDSDAFQGKVNDYRMNIARQFGDNNQEFENVLSVLRDIQADTLISSLQSDKFKNKSDYDYYRNFDGSLSADAQNAINEQTKGSKEINNTVTSSLASLLDSMSKSDSSIVRDFLRPLVALFMGSIQSGHLPSLRR